MLFCGNKPPFGAFHDHRRFPFLTLRWPRPARGHHRYPIRRVERICGGYTFPKIDTDEGTTTAANGSAPNMKRTPRHSPAAWVSHPQRSHGELCLHLHFPHPPKLGGLPPALRLSFAHGERPHLAGEWRSTYCRAHAGAVKKGYKRTAASLSPPHSTLRSLS